MHVQYSVTAVEGEVLPAYELSDVYSPPPPSRQVEGRSLRIHMGLSALLGCLLLCCMLM